LVSLKAISSQYSLQLENNYMSVEKLYEKARLTLGATKEERLKKSRARTVLMTMILRKQMENLEVSDELLNRKCTI
jgi:hypothetical protein